MNQCSYCNAKHLYQLKNGYIKCAQCKRKLSLKKHKRVLDTLDAFLNNQTALYSSQQLKINYITVSNYYMHFRKLITYYLDTVQQQEPYTSQEYDEYIYIKNDNIYTAQNFLTFVYNRKIYNLMMPSLYKFRTYDKSEEELSKFLFLNKIAKIESKNGLITQFWNYLEEFLKKFKGIHSGHFIYYLKEAEYKFNYPIAFQKEKLLELYYRKI